MSRIGRRQNPFVLFMIGFVGISAWSFVDSGRIHFVIAFIIALLLVGLHYLFRLLVNG